MADWSDLDAELARWDAAGAVATFWWRDDDVQAPTDALDRLLGLARQHDLPLHLAVVPDGLDPDLARRLAPERDVHTLQHGFAHKNHEPRGAGASEVGDHREMELQLRDLRDGWQGLSRAGLPNLLAGFVPPWNRISDRTVPHLAGLGYRLLSTSNPRATTCPSPGLTQVNIHVDPIRWKGGAHFRGEARILGAICQHLADRRSGAADPDEPTGLSTHHLQMTDEVWDFVEHLLDRLSRRPFRWLRLADLVDAA
jgi:hypothetical protein